MAMANDENIPEHSAGDVLRRRQRTADADPVQADKSDEKPKPAKTPGTGPLTEEECLNATRGWLASRARAAAADPSKKED